MDRKQQRKTLIQRRKNLEQKHLQLAAEQLAGNIANLTHFNTAQRIAGYLIMPDAGEINPMPTMKLALSLGKQCYVPVLCDKVLRFAAWSENCELSANRVGIDEPVVESKDLLMPEELDLVLVPLLGFDQQCNRLGMGGGFYDRSFAFSIATPPPPYLLGVAHDCQLMDDFQTESWDVPLHGVMTARHSYGSIMS